MVKTFLLFHFHLNSDKKSSNKIRQRQILTFKSILEAIIFTILLA